MDTIGSHWEDPEKVLNILDNRIKKGNTLRYGLKS